MKSGLLLAVAFAHAACARPAFAQDEVASASPALAAEQPDATVLPAAALQRFVIPRLTSVSLEILADLSSDGSKSLETFPIRLARPIALNGETLVREGVTGIGEVVHAKKAGGSGAPGELVLAARYLEVDGRQMRLRSLRFAESGESKIKDVNTLNTVAAATVPVIAFVGFLMKGGEIAVAQGSLVEARLAQDFDVAALPAEPAGSVKGNQDLEPLNSKEGEQDAIQ